MKIVKYFLKLWLSKNSNSEIHRSQGPGVHGWNILFGLNIKERFQYRGSLPNAILVLGKGCISQILH